MICRSSCRGLEPNIRSRWPTNRDSITARRLPSKPPILVLGLSRRLAKKVNWATPRVFSEATLREPLANLWQAPPSAAGEEALCLVELRGFEPLASCMPCHLRPLAVLSPAVRSAAILCSAAVK
jgi:hypothetical protein